MKPSTLARLAASLLHITARGPADSLLSSAASAPRNVWMGLRHRGQPPARGIMGKHNDPRFMGNFPGRRDRHRARVAAAHVGTTYPDFSAQRAQEAKAARSRKARHSVG